MPERRVSRPLEAERERALIGLALAEGWQVKVIEGSPYVILIDKIDASAPDYPPAAAPYDWERDG